MTAPPDDLVARLKLEAQCHAQEARTANATIAEIYRLCTDGKGEPGNWNGAEPVRAKLATLTAENKALRAAIGLVWSIHVRRHVHLGLERASGVEQRCIPCICAVALGESMDGDGGFTADDFKAARERLKWEDPAAQEKPK